MDRRRIARILRERARLDLELAEAFDEAAAAPDVHPVESPKARRAPSKPRVARPPGESDEVTQRKALSFLRDHGFARVGSR